MRKKIITNNFLNWYQTVLLYWNREEIKKYLDKFFWTDIELHEDAPWEHFYQYNSWAVCIYDDTKENTNEILIHEVTHAVQRMLDYLNIDCSYNNTELMANLMSFYVLEAMKFYKFKK